MAHDSQPELFEHTRNQDSSSNRDFLKLQLLCDRLTLSPVSVARLLKNLRADVGNLIGKTGNDVGFDAEFSGREFDLLFSFEDPTPRFGKKST
jgi:hypothetical protein